MFQAHQEYQQHPQWWLKTVDGTLAAPVETMIIKNAGHNWRKVDADIEP